MLGSATVSAQKVTTASIGDRVVGLVAAAKHKRIIRAFMVPLMSLQYARRDKAYKNSSDSEVIRSLKGKHNGDRCFIVGNGPSVTTEDLDKLVGEITFASNGIFNLFDKTVWRPTYYMAVDREFIAQEADVLANLPVERAFINLTPFSKKLNANRHITLINKRPGFFSSRKYTIDNIVFSSNPDLYVAEGYTVTYAAIQIALYMGFKDIYLIGIDHQYSHVADGKGNVVAVNGVTDHCYTERMGAHVNPQYRDGMEFAYVVGRIAADQRGAHIYNATRGGALEVFERVDFDKLIRDLQVSNR